MQRNILSDVSVREARGLIDQVMASLSNPRQGAYRLHQLKRFLRNEPLGVMTEKWQKQLDSSMTWKEAENYFEKSKKLWFNYPEWPFQICVLPVGGISPDEMIARFNERRFRIEGNNYRDYSKELFPTLDFIDEEKKLYLIRINFRTLGLGENPSALAAYDGYAAFNLERCPQETALHLYFHVCNDTFPIEEHSYEERTYMGMKPFLSDGVKKIFYFHYVGNRHYLGEININEKQVVPTFFPYWVYQYKRY